MASDYSKMKNDELQALLKQRSLPHTGKKADMVARLQEADAKTSSSEAPAPASKEDEIDWDDGADATTEPAAAAVAAGGQGRVENPAAVPNQVTAEDPAKTDDLSASAPAPTNTDTNGAAVVGDEKVEQKPSVDFSSGLKQTTEIEELERRLARGKKFNTLSKEEEEEILRKIDRAKKFGTDNASKGLNEALPERPLHKRRREGGDDGGRGGKRGGRRFGRAGGAGPDSGRRGPREDRQQGVRSGQGGWMQDKDREAAEKRKSRFADSAAS